MKSIILSLFVVMSFNLSLSAQTITWKDTTSSYNLPDGVKLFIGTRPSPLLKVWYLEVDMTKDNLALVPYFSKKSTQSITSFSTEVGAFAAINGGFFSTSNGASFSTVVNPGEVLSKNISALTRNGKSYPVIRSLFHINEDKTMSVNWIYHFGESVSDMYSFPNPISYTPASEPATNPISTDGVVFPTPYLGIGGGPTLVKNGESRVTFDEEIFWGSGVESIVQQPRSAVGYTADGKAILLVADGRQSVSQGFTLPELAQVMIALGCVEAMNLDGGGSSQMTVDKVLINKPDGGTFQRPIPTMLAVVSKDSIPGYEPPTEFEQNIDTGEADKVNKVGGWFESANAGFFGGTKSLIILSGDGSATITFKASLPNESMYDVYGWWVAAPNRSKLAPFVVYHKDGVDTVRKDQSTNNAQWVKIGTYTFTGTNADSVTISNKTNESNVYVVADAIRFVKVKATSVEDDFLISAVPNTIELQGNYPNPFNPTTTIKYRTNSTGSVSIHVFNSLGQRIDEKTIGFISAGNHSFQWLANQQSSGVYYYRIQQSTQVGLLSVSGKMTLIK